ncbi:MAG: flagellar assembly protein FliH [Deltaproteobacteria bacterium]|nr:flagellar assembly protein FliH [Deltaproteobacteria bacterium]
MSDEMKPLAILDLDEQVEVEPPQFRALMEDPPEAPEREEPALLEDPPEPKLDIESEARRIFEEAFAQGEKAGYEMGLNKAEPLIARLNQYLNTLDAFKQEVLGRVERFATALALTFAEAIVLKECSEHREITLAMIRKALESWEDKGETLIRLPKEDAWLISAQEPISWKIIPDDELTEPGFVIETSFGDIDGRISKQLDELKKSFS